MDTIMLLYAAGETLEDKIPEELNFEDEKLQLKHICRMVIQDHLLMLDSHWNLFGRIPRLGLPSSLTDYLLFNVTLDTEDVNDDDDDDDDGYDDDDGDDDDDDDDFTVVV